VIAKPFLPAELAAAIAGVLAVPAEKS